VERGDLAFGTVDSFLLWRMTAGAVHATDATNASRTALYDIHANAWSAELCALFGVPGVMLPEVRGAKRGHNSYRSPSIRHVEAHVEACRSPATRHRAGGLAGINPAMSKAAALAAAVLALLVRSRPVRPGIGSKC
jgi:glycerol kinase